MKLNPDFQGEHYLFRRDQVLSTDLREFLRRYEPSRLNPFELRTLFGSVSIELEDAVKCGDLLSVPEARTLLRGLDAVWPWIGFFLDLTKPLGSPDTLGSLPMLAYGLSIIDLELIAWDRTATCSVRPNKAQFLEFQDRCFRAVTTLGCRAEIPFDVLVDRKNAISGQLTRILLFP